MTTCVFCRLLAGELPAAFVYRDDCVVAFMDAGQVNDGHVIVATVRHVETIYGIDDDLLPLQPHASNVGRPRCASPARSGTTSSHHQDRQASIGEGRHGRLTFGAF